MVSLHLSSCCIYLIRKVIYVSSFKEIVTKAVIGKAKKTTTNSFSFTPEESPNTVLGCWVINNKFSGSKSNDGSVVVNGSFDVNVWYSYDADKKTAVATQNFSYTDTLRVPLKEDHALDDATEIIVRTLRQPTVTNVAVESGVVKLDIEKEIGVEIVGDTKVKVSVEETFDDYEEIVDDDLELNDDYLEEEKEN